MSNTSTIPAPDQTFNGNRKLVRPTLPPRTNGRREPANQEAPLTHALHHDSYHHLEASHAEVFYFQKQIAQKTEMVVVLDDGEQLIGQLEWYDRCVIKLCLTSRQRILVYKNSIKYLYKANEPLT